MNVSLTSKGQRLPVAFRALDVEATTKRMPGLICPARNDMGVGSCSSCSCDQRIDLDDDGAPEVTCRTRGVDFDCDRVCSDSEVKDMLHVPVVCAAAETTIAVVRPYLDLQAPLDVIPILDRHARPFGIVSCAELRQRIEEGIDQTTPLASLMSTCVPRVLPCTTLGEAALVRKGVGFGGVMVVGVDGSLLGLVSARDLAVH